MTKLDYEPRWSRQPSPDPQWREFAESAAAIAASVVTITCFALIVIGLVVLVTYPWT